MDVVPILNYHGIEKQEGEYVWSETERPYVISTENFSRQFDFLSANQFRSLSSDELGQWLNGTFPCERPMVLTFDDGHASHYEYVAPMLKARNFKAIFFVPAGLVGQSHQMTWEQLKELVRNGFEIGSHGFSHVPLSNLTHHELWKELERSKLVLENRLGIKVKSFSVPRGYYQLRIREAALDLGYRFIFTSRFDINYRKQDHLRLNRLVVKRRLSFNRFTQIVRGDLGYIRVLEKAKETARRFLKPSFYDALADVKRLLTHG